MSMTEVWIQFGKSCTKKWKRNCISYSVIKEEPKKKNMGKTITTMDEKTYNNDKQCSYWFYC